MKFVEELLHRDELLSQLRPMEREITRLSKRIIASALKGDYPDTGDMDTIVRRMISIAGESLIHTPTVQNALQEYAEAIILLSVLKGDNVPEHTDLKIDAVPYALGLGDAVGEMRRAFMISLEKGNVEEAKRLLQIIDHFTDLLSSCVVPNEIAPLRRKTDVARALVDRCHSDLLHFTSGPGLLFRWGSFSPETTYDPREDRSRRD